MRRTLARWLSTLLIICLLLSAPAALMEAAEPVEAEAEVLASEGMDYEDAPEAADVLEAPVDEISLELGEVAEESAEPLVAEYAAEADDGIKVIECEDDLWYYVNIDHQVRLVPANGAAIASCKSSDTEVAVIDDKGLVTPTGFGGTDITISLKNGKKLELHLSTMTDDDDVVEIECENDQVYHLNRTHQAQLIPMGGIAAKSFKSSDTEIARVSSSGIVTPVNTGLVNVTITLKGGDKLTVLLCIFGAGRDEGSWGLLIPTTKTIRMTVGESLTLLVDSALGDEVTPKAWRTSDKTVSTVSKSGVVKAKKVGVARIEVELNTPWPMGGYGERFIKVVDPDAKAEKGTAIDEKHFPDAAFREYIQFFFDANDDGKLSKSEIAGATTMELDCDGMKSLAGIEIFTGLKHLELYGLFKVASLDLSKNTKLEHLFLEDPDKLTAKTLNISNNTKLTSLGIEHTEKLIYPDPSPFKKLTEVSVGDNKVKTLDFSKNTALQTAYIWENDKLTKLNISKLSALKELEVKDNEKLKTLDIRSNAALQKLDVSGNDLIKRLDITGCTLLIDLVNRVEPEIDEDENEIVYESGSKRLVIERDMTLTGEGLYPTVALAKSSAKYTAYAGEIFKLTLNGAKAKSYASSKKSVAKVSKYGVVTPVKAGTATITVTLSTNKARKLTLTVKDPDAVAIDQGKTATLKVKGSLKLTASVHNAATLTWSSSKPSVAKVNAKTGKVTAVKAGTATVTVTTDKGKKATIKLTVKK